MAIHAPKLIIKTPVGEIQPGRGFYQLEDESLYVQIAPYSRSRRFFSFLESENVRLDIDRQGRLLFVEVSLPRKSWTIVKGSAAAKRLSIPHSAQSADVRWLDFRERLREPSLETDEKNSLLVIRFSKEVPHMTCILAESIYLDISKENRAIAIWVTIITDDKAGQQIAAFRKRIFRVQTTEHLPPK